LGRPPKNPEISAAHKQHLCADQRRRNEVEGYFGSEKRKYSLDLIMAGLSKSVENSISMAFVVMCAEEIRRLLRLFFITILPGYAPGNGQVVSGWGSGTFGSLKHTNH
jgi:transposase, IS5 family